MTSYAEWTYEVASRVRSANRRKGRPVHPIRQNQGKHSLPMFHHMCLIFGLCACEVFCFDFRKWIVRCVCVLNKGITAAKAYHFGTISVH